MHAAGYDVGDPDALAANGDALLAELIDRCSYDTELLTETQLRPPLARVPTSAVPGVVRRACRASNQRQMAERWGAPPGESYVHDGHIALAGLRFGNVFVAIQPPRGYGMDPNLIYHQPDLPPTHNYHALYRWLRDDFRRRRASCTWASTARWSGCRARARTVGDVLPGPAAGRPAADLPVHHQRPRRGRAGQAARARGDRGPSDAADDDRRRVRRAGRAGAAGRRVLPGRGARPDQAAACCSSRSGS